MRHFAGNVCYMAAHFLDKNNDTLHTDFETALSASGSGLIAAMFKPAEPKAGAGGARRKASAFNSVARRFMNDLDSLMVDLNSTYVHFVRCLKPNLQLQPQTMSPKLVLNQLRCSGTFEAVQLIAASYPSRIPYADIHGRYKEHMPDFVQALEPALFTEAVALACGVSEADYQLGLSKIFLRPGKGSFLEELKDRDMSEVVPMLVAKIKEWEVRKQARIVVATRLSGWAMRRRYLGQRSAATKLQATRRMAVQRRKFKVELAEARAALAKARAEAAQREEEARLRAEAERRQAEDAPP